MLALGEVGQFEILNTVVRISFLFTFSFLFEKVMFEKSHKGGKGMINEGIWKMSWTEGRASAKAVNKCLVPASQSNRSMWTKPSE